MIRFSDTVSVTDVWRKTLSFKPSLRSYPGSWCSCRPIVSSRPSFTLKREKRKCRIAQDGVRYFRSRAAPDLYFWLISRAAIIYRKSFLTQTRQTFSGSSFLKVRICCFSLSVLTVNENSLGFGLLDGQNISADQVSTVFCCEAPEMFRPIRVWGCVDNKWFYIFCFDELEVSPWWCLRNRVGL